MRHRRPARPDRRPSIPHDDRRPSSPAHGVDEPTGEVPLAQPGLGRAPAPSPEPPAGTAPETPARVAGSVDGGASPPTRRGRRHRFSRRVRLLFSAAALLCAAVVGVVAWYEIEAHPLGSQGRRVIVNVTQGEGTGAVASALQRSGVIGSALAFRLSLLVHPGPAIQPGGYVLHGNEPFSEVRSVLYGGPDVYVIDVAPGYTLHEVAKELGGVPGGIARSFLSEATHGAVASPYQAAPSTTLEGLLGTGTYRVLPGESAHKVLAQMVERFGHQAASAGLTPSAAAAVGLTPYQVVTVASIVQKEGYYTRYMGKVARVIYNRLGAGMPLDMTSTVLYSIGQDGGPVTAKDQQLNTPYNTYLHTGLTPTPICFSSVNALAAALRPPAGSWLYFDVVTAARGKMVFSSTYQQQLRAEQRAKASQQRQGQGGPGTTGPGTTGLGTTGTAAG